MSDTKSALIVPTKREVDGVMQYKNGFRPRITLKPATDGKAYECSVEDAKWLEKTGDFKKPVTKKATKDKTGGGE